MQRQVQGRNDVGGSLSMLANAVQPQPASLTSTPFPRGLEAACATAWLLNKGDARRRRDKISDLPGTDDARNRNRSFLISPSTALKMP